jgi:hypothetical protein
MNRDDYPDRNRSGHRQDLFPQGRVTRSLLGYGPLAGAVYVGSIFIQGLTRRGFSILHDDASLRANGPLGWLQVATFLVTGAMTIAAAAGVRRALPSRWAPRLIGLTGAALMTAGVFRADPGRWSAVSKW